MIDVRDRLTDRINRARVTVELRRSLRPLAVIAVGALIGLGFWAYLLVHVGKTSFVSTRTVKFTVADASGVVAGRHQVRIKGIEVGTITDTQLVHGQAVLTGHIEKSYGPVYR
ncbi:MAG: MCE-family protein Mce6D, partial [Solirubrobacterales bacterium]|nr:MCE-family protein Mce6D [Solirubrobacterales bacterium]